VFLDLPHEDGSRKKNWWRMHDGWRACQALR
jgi:hypothetical protein